MAAPVEEGIVKEASPRDETRGKRGAPRSGKPTLRTIAEMTGLAITTISRALNNAPELSQETRERVQRIAAEIGYVPDRTALRLKTGRTHVVTLVLDPHAEILNFSQSLVAGITSALRGTAYHLVITPAFRGASPLDPINYVLNNKMADGVIFSRTEPDDARVKLLLENDFPFVCHGRTGFEAPHPYVDYDNAAFAYAAVARLAAKGRRHVAMIAPAQRFSFGQHLFDGFTRGARDAGIETEIIEGVTLDDGAETIRAATVKRIATGNAPDGYVCPGDAVALAVMAGIADSGQVIGRDVDIVTKQMSGIFSLVRPRVDVISEDIALAGEQMGELLLRRINGEPSDGLQILQVPEIPF
ncbi:MAG: LacI family transcriptional regulator [Devosia sp.]